MPLLKQTASDCSEANCHLQNTSTNAVHGSKATQPSSLQHRLYAGIICLDANI
jgi:hypothetical protein